MHFRHKWKTIFNEMGKVMYHHYPTLYSPCHDEEKEAVFVIQRCFVCGKEKGYYKHLNGMGSGVDPAYIRARFNIKLE